MLGGVEIISHFTTGSLQSFGSKIMDLRVAYFRVCCCHNAWQTAAQKSDLWTPIANINSSEMIPNYTLESSTFTNLGDIKPRHEAAE